MAAAARSHVGTWYAGCHPVKIEDPRHERHHQVGFMLKYAPGAADVYFQDRKTAVFDEKQLAFCTAAERTMAPQIDCWLCLTDGKEYDGKCDHHTAQHQQEKHETPMSKCCNQRTPVQVHDPAHPRHGQVGYLAGRYRGAWIMYMFKDRVRQQFEERQLRVCPIKELEACPPRDCMVCRAEGDDLHPPNGGCQWVCRHAVSRHVVCIVCINDYSKKWGNNCCICDRP